MIGNTKKPELDKLIPDELIKNDLSKVLWTENTEEEPIEIEEQYVVVPHASLVEVVSKSYRENLYKVGFGKYYAAQVAIGGVIKEECGIIYPKYCFATLFYNSDKEMITLDFHAMMR